MNYTTIKSKENRVKIVRAVSAASVSAWPWILSRPRILDKKSPGKKRPRKKVREKLFKYKLIIKLKENWFLKIIKQKCFIKLSYYFQIICFNRSIYSNLLTIDTGL